MYLVKNADFQLIELYVSEKMCNFGISKCICIVLSAGKSKVIISCYPNANGTISCKKTPQSERLQKMA